MGQRVGVEEKIICLSRPRLVKEEKEKRGEKKRKTTTFQWGWIASGRGRKTSAGRTGRGEWALHRFKVLYQSSFVWRGGACHPKMFLNLQISQ